jgi:hypothetical protein
MIIFFFAKINVHDAFGMLLTLELYRSYTHDYKYNGLEHNYIYSKSNNNFFKSINAWK